MKKYLFYVLLFFSFPVLGKSDKTLYVLTGYPNPDSEQQFESGLWQYRADSMDLQQVYSFLNADECLLSIKLYSEYGYFSLLKNSTWRQDIAYDSLFLFDTGKMSMTHLAVNVKDYHVTYSGGIYLIQPSFGEKVIALEMFRNFKPVNLYYAGLNLSSLQLDSLSLAVLDGIYLTGFTGGEVESQDYMLTYSREEDGYLEMMVTGDRKLRPVFPYELPEEYRFGTYAIQLVCINTSNYFIVSGNECWGTDKLGSVPLFIYNKKTNVWKEKTIIGTLPRIRSFGAWIAGFVGDDNEDLLTRPLPGSSFWKERSTGLTLSEVYKGMYAPGVLYLYNPGTDVYIEWSTGQADSEIVLVDDGKVLYRVYDELYEAPLLSGKRLGKSRLLLKDARVPDLHWAFYR